MQTKKKSGFNFRTFPAANAIAFSFYFFRISVPLEFVTVRIGLRFEN